MFDKLEFSKITSMEQGASKSNAPVMDKSGVVTDCIILSVRRYPSLEADVICTIPCLTEVLIDESKSTKMFYKIRTESGTNGYCMKKYIAVRP